ncbi:MAG: MFS transporter [Promethearchaeia archaeon]
MSEKNKMTERVPKKIQFYYSLGEVGDGVAYQTFTFLIFTFYFAVVRIPLMLITTGFIIWSGWNSINDLLVGFISDKTISKHGRRIIWMRIAIAPLAIIMVLLFTPPLNAEVPFKFLYFLLILFLFDLIYTAWNLNYNAFFSEQFTSMKGRSEVGKIRGIFVIVSLIFAFVLPSFIIEDMANQYGYSYTPFQYMITGIIAAIIISVSLFLVITKGIARKTEFEEDAKTAPSIKRAMKITLSNKTFLIFMIPALGTWICSGILPTAIPLYATYVLGIADQNSILIGVLLLAAFLVAGMSMTLWEKIRRRKGARFAGLLAFILWAIGQFIFMYMRTFPTAVAALAFAGIGLGGSLYFYDQCLAEIIDEDEIKHKTRRSGAYYGIISFIIRMSGVINFLVIGLVFQGTEWASNYSPNPGVNVLAGLQVLVGWFPIIVLIIAFIGLYFYPIKGERLDTIRKKVDLLHLEKQKK